MGIRAKLALLVPGVVALTLIASALFVTDSQDQELREDFLTRHEQVLDAVGITAAVDVAQNDMGALDSLVNHLTQSQLDADLVELAVVDSDCRILAHSDPTRFNEVLNTAMCQRAVRTEQPVSEWHDKELVIAVPARSGLRWATIIGRYSVARRNAQIARARRSWLLLSAFLTVVLSLGLAVGLERMVIRPVRLLQRAARRMEEGDLSAQVPQLRSELGQLGDAFNKMASALRAQRDNLERAVAERTRELREANGRLEKLAVTDGLTGIFNHRRFQEALAQEASRSQRTKRPFSVLMLDVDHFKQFNDTLGHPAGDELLRKLAQTLTRELRQVDVLARYGGEEFAVLLPESSKDEALLAAERLRRAVELTCNTVTSPSRVTVSVGVASLGEDGERPQDVLQAADQALYRAKRTGRNRVVAAGSWKGAAA